MNLDKIIAVIEKHAHVDSETLKQAQDLHQKFPFTSIFPMIILKGLKENKNIHFDGELKKLSIQVNDRAVLERFLEQELEQEQEQEQQVQEQEQQREQVQEQEQVQQVQEQEQQRE